MFQGEYVCLPYTSIQTRRIATGDGKVKGTRKLIIPYITDNGLASVEIDDTKVQEEKLRELLLERGDFLIRCICRMLAGFL